MCKHMYTCILAYSAGIMYVIPACMQTVSDACVMDVAA